MSDAEPVMSGGVPFDVPCARGRWRIERAAEKLSIRGALPGAFNYDRTAAALRVAREAGVPAAALLAPAMPGSWMVNNRAPSSVLKGWLSGDGAVAAFDVLLRHLDTGPAGWLERDQASRDEVTAAVRALSSGDHRACAVSKVLALLCPDTVPLMDDAALWLMTGGAEYPQDAEHPSADADAFVPMVDAFCAAVQSADAPLAALAAGYPLARSSPSQILDRLLWFDSWGHRVVRPAWTLEDLEGLVRVTP